MFWWENGAKEKLQKATSLRCWLSCCHKEHKMSNEKQNRPKRCPVVEENNQLCPLHVKSACQCFLISVLLALLLSVGACMCGCVCVCVCIYVCVFCLPGCWTNSREIILPQSPSLSGQSDEELVIFNTAGGVVQVSERPNSLSVSAETHLTSPSVSPLCVFFFTVGSFQMAR